MHFSDTAAGSLADAPAPDRQFVRLHPEIFLVGESAVTITADIDAGPLQHGGDADADAIETGVERVDEDLVLVQLDVAQPARTGWPSLRGRHELNADASWRTGLDR
jgi:hypothetical protein